MKDVEYRAENLALYEYTRVEEHLSSMAAKGWRLESIGARLWKYRRAEPANVRYAVPYVRDASHPGPLETEESIRLEAVHRSMKRNFLPANIIALLGFPDRLVEFNYSSDLTPERMALVGERLKNA